MKDLNKARKIKLLFIVDFINSTTGGTERQLLKIINSLPRKKYEICLLSLRNTTWIMGNMSKLDCPVFTSSIIKLKNPLNIALFSLIVKKIRNISPDIVVTLFPLSNVLGVIAARLANVKVIISTRRDYGLWLNRWSVYCLRLANRFIKGVVTNSYAVKTLLSVEEKLDSSKIHVIYNGLDLEDFEQCTDEAQALKKKLGVSEHQKVIGIVGNLRPMKRHETFVKSAKRVLKVRPDVNFLIVGDGPLRADIEALAAKLGIKNYVRLVGRQEDVLPFLSIFDIGVNCSANEGLSNAIMEYMACGVPCIAARAGGNPELIKNGVNGYTFELDNDKKLAELIVSLLENKRKQEEFALKSKDIVSNKLNIKRMIWEYDNLFTQMLEGNCF